jgi:hypothetical protein
MRQFFVRIFETPFYEGGKFEVPTNRLRKNVAASVLLMHLRTGRKIMTVNEVE